MRVTLGPVVPPQYKDFIIICTETWTSTLLTRHQGAGGGRSYLEGAVGQVTDVDDVIGGVAEHLSKPIALHFCDSSYSDVTHILFRTSLPGLC